MSILLADITLINSVLSYIIATVIGLLLSIIAFFLVRYVKSLDKIAEAVDAIKTIISQYDLRIAELEKSKSQVWENLNKQKESIHAIEKDIISLSKK